MTLVRGNVTLSSGKEADHYVDRVVILVVVQRNSAMEPVLGQWCASTSPLHTFPSDRPVALTVRGQDADKALRTFLKRDRHG